MSRSPLYSAGHVQLPIRVLLLRSPCASRQQVQCSASRVVPGAHQVVSPGTHRGSGPREVHTTTSAFCLCMLAYCKFMIMFYFHLFYHAYFLDNRSCAHAVTVV
jgi:hypothetical protein